MASKDKKLPEKRDDSSKAEIMQRLKTRPLLYIGSVLILVIVVIAFVFVPALGPESFGSGDLTFGSYNRVPIKFVPGNYFHQVYQSLSRNLPQGGDTNDIFMLYNLWAQRL